MSSPASSKVVKIEEESNLLNLLMRKSYSIGNLEIVFMSKSYSIGNLEIVFMSK